MEKQRYHWRRTSNRYRADLIHRPWHEQVDHWEFMARLGQLPIIGDEGDADRHSRRAAHNLIAAQTRLQVEAEMAGWQPVAHHDYRMTEQVEYIDDDMESQPVFGGPMAHSNGVLEYLDWWSDGEYEHHSG